MKTKKTNTIFESGQNQIFFNVFDKKCSGHKKFQLPLDELSHIQLGAIRTHLYHSKSTH